MNALNECMELVKSVCKTYIPKEINDRYVCYEVEGNSSFAVSHETGDIAVTVRIFVRHKEDAVAPGVTFHHIGYDIIDKGFETCFIRRHVEDDTEQYMDFMRERIKRELSDVLMNIIKECNEALEKMEGDTNGK